MNVIVRLARNFAILLFGNVLGQLLFLFGIVLLARRIGPEAFGWWSFAQALALYLLRAGEFGLEVTSIRAVAKDESIVLTRVGEVLALRTALAFALVVLTTIAIVVGLVPEKAGWLVAIFSLVLFPVGATVEWVYEAKQQVGAISIARVLKGLLFLFFVFCFIRDRNDVETSAALYVASLTIPSIYLLVLVQRQFRVREFGISKSRAKTLLKEAWPIAVATLFSQYSLFFGTTFLGYRGAGEEVGVYSAAHRLIVFVWAYGITTAHRVLLPSLSQTHDASASEFRSRLLTAVRMSVLVALPIGVLTTLVGPDVVQLLYGEGYATAGGLLRLLVWALVIGIFRSPFDIGLLAASRQKVYLRGVCMLAVSHTILDPVGYLFGGLEGLAMGVVGAEMFYALYLFLQYERSLISQTLRSAAKPLGASIVTVAALTLVPFSWEFKVMAGIAAYIACLIALGELTAEDRKVIREFFGVSSGRIF